jgi:copper chaperone
MTDISLQIEDMSCQHCVMSVKKALDNTKGITSSEVTVGNAQVTYDGAITSDENIIGAVINAGYKVVTQ